LITIPPYIAIQADELRAEYSALELFGKPTGPWKIIGPLTFNATYNNKTIANTIPVIINIPSDFPKTLPTVRAHQTQVIEKYPHINVDDKTFCMGTPIRLKMSFSENPTLLFFVKKIVVPFLYSAFHWRETGRMPFADSDHGPLGILQEYCLLFNVYDPEIVLDFLEILIKSEIYFDRLCPCGSRKPFQSCHSALIQEISRHQNSKAFFIEFHSILSWRKALAKQATKKTS